MTEYNPRDDFNRSLNDCYSEVRKRMAKGGPAWDGNRIVDEREKTHGNFAQVAYIAYSLRAVLRGRGKLTNVQDEALNMICTKLARIVCGDANCDDHWADIAGYAELARKAGQNAP